MSNIVTSKKRRPLKHAAMEPSRAGVVLLLACLMTASGAAAMPPLGSIVNVETDDQYDNATDPGGTVFFARTARRAQGEPFEWWLRIDVRIRNFGGYPMRITGFTLDTDVTAPVNKPLVVPVDIGPGNSKVIVVPGGLAGSAAQPSSLTIKANVLAHFPPMQKIVNLEAFASNTATGGYRFPFKGADLGTNIFLGVGAHKNSVEQKWALDIGGRRWNEDTQSWDNLTDAAYNHALPGSLNSHYVIWNLPVYSVAAGTIRRCWRSIADHAPGGGSGGGNSVIVEHGNGEWAAYHHLRRNTVPAALCPTEGPVGDDWLPLAVPVAAGQEIGRVGTTGASGGPHLHFQITGEAPVPSSTTLRPLPINFFRLAVHHDGFVPDANVSSFYHITQDDPAALSTNMLMRPTL